MVFHLRQPDASHRFLTYLYQDACQTGQGMNNKLISKIFHKLFEPQQPASPTPLVPLCQHTSANTALLP